MPTFDFLGSIAQKYVQFVTSIITTTVPGANFSKLMIFVDYADQATFFVSDPQVDTITEVTSTNYAQLLKGLLKTWLDGFYLSKSVAPVEIVTVADSSGTFSVTDLPTQYSKYNERAYFKTAIGATTAHNIANNVHLASLCEGDPLSQFIYGSSDATILTLGANNEAYQFVGTQLTGMTATFNATTTVSSVSGNVPNQGWVGAGIQGTYLAAGTTITAVSGTTLTLSQAASGSGSAASFTLVFDYDVPIVYHPSTTLNPALVQLGATFAQVNPTGGYCGNKLDFLSISGFSASGSAGANLTATQSANAATAGVAFFTTLGDGSGNVLLEGGVAGRGWTTPKAANIGANWVVAYVDTVSSILCAQFLAQAGRFKNNDTYQGCLALLTTQLNLFEGLGRLGTLKITAPSFANLPASSGGIITVPNAWSAVYQDNVRSTTVYGTLYLTQ
jgi:hypothetical protein